jgi:hypothetical protein
LKRTQNQQIQRALQKVESGCHCCRDSTPRIAILVVECQQQMRYLRLSAFISG